ncbi:peptidase [Methylobacterium sp. Leaf104]|uniref:PepSY domain-containing protein n=1 Tax=Methylobacterium TaxID=407 RepID=UPI0006FE2E6F|nr:MULTISPECIES: PepSY domain-containing protein [Methylobacterium]KQP40822.1 peptidase [Methylobacterium sp. Leaf104]MCI9880989.1 PepSY domain-containing protein [Methylobacterium goesingense]
MSRHAHAARAALLTVLLAGPGVAAADTPGADWLTPAQTKQALTRAGYSEITKLEADDGHWDGEGIKDGRRMRFDADPKTGAILGEVPVE